MSRDVESYRPVVDELEAQRISRWEHPPLVRFLRRRFEAVLSAGAE